MRHINPIRFLIEIFRQDYISLTRYSEESGVKSVFISRKVIYSAADLIALFLVLHSTAVVKSYNGYRVSLYTYTLEANRFQSDMLAIHDRIGSASEVSRSINQIILKLSTTLPYAADPEKPVHTDPHAEDRWTDPENVSSTHCEDLPEIPIDAFEYLSDFIQDLTETTIRMRTAVDKLQSVPDGLPVGGWLVSDFGLRKSPFSGYVSLHRGIDIVNRTGTPVKASGNGIVSFAGRKRLWGNTVLIDHAYDVLSQYGHLNTVLVEEGALVKKGDIIGTVGMTGRTTGPHLHYQVWVNDKPHNPLLFISEFEQKELQRIKVSGTSPETSPGNVGGGID